MFEEYNTLLIRMQLAKEIGIKNLEAYGSLKLIVNQVRGEYKVWHEFLVPYHNAAINMAEKFKSFYINHVPHQKNAPCRCIDIPHRFIGSSSQSDKESTRTQPWLVLPKICLWRQSDSRRRASSQWGFWGFNRSTTQRLVILIHRLCLIRHIS